MTSPVSPGRPEISVLMSCYNGGRWLAEAIESVLAQTYRELEFILVDDGSADNTAGIIRSYAGRDPRIVFLPKRNTGLPDSLNAGLALARGAWIARVDQDDLCEPERLERQLAFARANPGVVLLGSGFSEINAEGAVIKEHRYPAGHSALVARLERLQGFFPHSSAFFLADAARKAGGYNTHFTRSEDWMLWLELSLGGKVACLPAPLVRIRKHPGQMSLDANGARQFCDAAAAVVCYWLQKEGRRPPSKSPDKDAWAAFLAWVDGKIEASGVLGRRNTWGEARRLFFSGGSGVPAALKAFRRLLRDERPARLLWEKAFGFGLPESLAREWAPLEK